MISSEPIRDGCRLRSRLETSSVDLLGVVTLLSLPSSEPIRDQSSLVVVFLLRRCRRDRHAVVIVVVIVVCSCLFGVELLAVPGPLGGLVWDGSKTAPRKENQ